MSKGFRGGFARVNIVERIFEVENDVEFDFEVKSVRSSMENQSKDVENAKIFL